MAAARMAGGAGSFLLRSVSRGWGAAGAPGGLAAAAAAAGAGAGAGAGRRRTFLSTSGGGGGAPASSFSQPFPDPTAVAPRPTPGHFGFAIVPEKSAYVIERFGRFLTVLSPGLHLLIPVVDRIAYVHSLKEETIPIHRQAAITKDNVSLTMDGVLYIRVHDPVKASYGVELPLFAVAQLAQTAMRSELGKITLDKTFEERDALNHNITRTINEATESWGLKCLRYEIRDIIVPTGVKAAMELQAEAERRKRASILESEGERLSEVNVAEGKKRMQVLSAEGEAQSILLRAEATATAISKIADRIDSHRGADGSSGGDAIRMILAEQYVDAFGKLAKETNTIIMNNNHGVNDVAAMVTTAMGVWDGRGGGGGAARIAAPAPAPVKAPE